MPNKNSILKRITEIDQRIEELENEIYDFLKEDGPQRSDQEIQAEKKDLKKEKERLEKQLASTALELPAVSSKVGKENKIYETFNDPNLNCNQWVIEIHKKGEWEYHNGEKRFREDFSAYHNIFNALMRLGEQKACVYALLNYLNNNKHLFNFVLWRANFEKLTGVKETTYREGINALFYYGILEKTNRIKRNEKGTCCKVYIFHIDLDIESLSAERFNPKNPEHMKIVKDRKG